MTKSSRLDRRDRSASLFLLLVRYGINLQKAWGDEVHEYWQRHIIGVYPNAGTDSREGWSYPVRF